MTKMSCFPLNGMPKKAIYIYIYIYIYYILSSTDRVFRCITTLQGGNTRRTLEAGIETRPTIRYTQYQTAQPTSAPRQLGNYEGLSSSIRLFIFYTLPDIRVLNSFEELCLMQAAAENSFARFLNPHGGAYILSSTDRLFRCITLFSVAR